MIKLLFEDKSVIDASMGLSRGAGIGVFATFLAIIVAFYLLRSVALIMLAKKSDENVKGVTFLAWIPIAWIYLATRLAGKVIMFGKPVKRFDIIITVIFAVTEALTITHFLLTYIPLISYILGGGEIGLFMGANTEGITDRQLLNLLESAGYNQYYLDGTIFVKGPELGYAGANMQAIAKASEIIYYINSVMGLVSAVTFIFFYITFFKRYYPQRMVVAVVLSFILNIFPIFVFAVRNRKPINYNDYVRQRYAYMYGQQPGNPYGAPRPAQPETPFEDFAEPGEGKDSDPFGEFSDKKSNDDPFEDFDDKND